MPTHHTLPAGWTGLEVGSKQLHLSHLLIPLGMQGLTIEVLLQRIEETHAICDQERQAMGLNTTGSHELIIHPNRRFVTPVLTLQKQPLETFTLALATSLMPIIGQNGCGPDSPADCLDYVQESLAFAKKWNRPVSHSYASLCDLLIFPDGHWLIYGDGLHSSVTLIRPDTPTTC